MTSPELDHETRRIADAIDHAALSPNTSRANLEKACTVAATFRVAALCVRPRDVAEAAARLEQSGVAVAAVIGFPHGHFSTEIKLLETRAALDAGAGEIDFVIDLPAAIDGRIDDVATQARAIVSVCRERGAITKAIIETAYHGDVRIAALCEALVKAGVDFLKTSTGFAPAGATLEHVAIMKRAADGRARIKASGGIRTREQALAFLDSGCSRIGTSATETILAASR